MTTIETRSAAPSSTVAEQAAAIAPVLSEHAPWGDQHRRLHDEVVDALIGAGVHRLRVAARHGGHQSDVATTTEVLEQLGRADGAASWVASIWSISTWITGLFPDEAQDEIFSSPQARVAGILSPGGMAAPAGGGDVVLNGRWSFNSAVLHSDWDLLAAVSPTPDGGHQPVMVLVPTAELGIVDDWDTAGLRGTGSVTSLAENVRVPAHRVMALGPMLGEQYGSTANAGVPAFSTPVIPTGSASVNGTVLGMAEGALETFLGRLPGRGISYTSHDDRTAHPLTHMQVAEASMKIDEARFHARRAAEQLDDVAFTGGTWTTLDRARIRLDSAMVARLAKEAVDILRSAGGASATYAGVPLQRFARDLDMVSVHALMKPDTNLELYGRVALGLGPNTAYL